MTLLVLVIPISLVLLLWLTAEWELAGAGWRPFLNRLFGPGAEDQGVERGDVSELADRALPHDSVTPSVSIAPPRKESACRNYPPVRAAHAASASAGSALGRGTTQSPHSTVYDQENEPDTMPVWAMHFLLDLDAAPETEDRP